MLYVILFFKEIIEYKNIYVLRRFITFQGKIIPKRLTKLTYKQHRFTRKSFKNSAHFRVLTI
uniref:Ribosomal protein S18 n=1 Tax=Euglena hiemalis TaxID=392896 RepID=A0A345UC48_9EUGL|nr:ribosomal protein S18 [Euglena hiemalis]AXI98034.1 ribosomal protein S18 [Euglena hiemalis]